MDDYERVNVDFLGYKISKFFYRKGFIVAKTYIV